MTNEEWMSITLIKKLFGKDVLQTYTILVFTHGDTYEEDEDSHGLSLLQWLQCQRPEIVKLVDECNKRCFIINNREKDPGTMRKQVIQLVSLIDRYVKENSGQMYTNDLFQFVQAELKKEEENIKQEQELIKKEEEEIKKKNEDERCKLQDELDKAMKELAARIENKHENVGAKMIPVVNASGRSCFPPDALVRLEDGKIIAMVNMKVRHKVLSSVSNAKLEYSEVYFFAHLDPWNQSQYICICASKYNLKLTPDHHIFIVGNCNTLDSVPAEKKQCR